MTLQRLDGAALRRARLASGMSLQKTSIVMARYHQIVTSETIRLWELNHSEPRITQFFLICDVLRVKPSALLSPVEVEL